MCSVHSKRISHKPLVSLIMSIMTKIPESYNAATPSQRFTSHDFSCHYLKTHLLSVYVSFYHLTTFQLPYPYSTNFLDTVSLFGWWACWTYWLGKVWFSSGLLHLGSENCDWWISEKVLAEELTSHRRNKYRKLIKTCILKGRSYPLQYLHCKF